jgi:predicted nuclease of restriction endonuclease-like (RecB) superfamily
MSRNFSASRPGHISESDLEAAIVEHTFNIFYWNLAKGFLFESRQKRFTFDEEHISAEVNYLTLYISARCHVLSFLPLKMCVNS